MKKILSLALISLIAVGAQAQEAEKKADNKPVFTTIKENPITSIKDQNRSGTCWDYSTLSFFEAEILKATGKAYDLEESFIANKTYMDRAIQVVRFHGDCQFSQGGSAEDVLATMKKHGIVPQGIMPFPGSLYGDSLNNFMSSSHCWNPMWLLLPRVLPRRSAISGKKVCRVSSMLIWENVLKSSPTKARSTPRKASCRVWASTSMTM
jgi:hypothetical protein